MKPTPAPRLDPFRADDADELVPKWRAAFEDAVGIVDPHPIAAQRDYLFREVLPLAETRVARIEDRMAGFVAANREKVLQLYVFIGWQRRGIGAAMLDWAKARSGGSLHLYTFARNARACAFYEKQGFVVAARGFEPAWQLDDVRYAWTRPGTDAAALR